MIKIKQLIKNKYVGSTRSRVLTGQRVEFECPSNTVLPEEFFVVYHDPKVKKGTFLGEDINKYFGDIRYADITINQINDYTDIHHAPTPEYKIIYEDTLVTCEECGKESVWQDYYDDDFYDMWVEDICPKCEIGNRNFPRFETIEEFQDRQ